MDDGESRAGTSWVTLYAPQVKADLCVNSKKLSEVEDWFCSNYSSASAARGGEILLLTGPAGSGKSTTISVLAKALDVTVENYSSVLLSLSDGNWFKEYDVDSNNEHFQTMDSHWKQFSKFLHHSNMDSVKCCKKLLLVEDVDFMLRFVSMYQDIIRSYLSLPCPKRAPLVFVVTEESYPSQLGFKKLFTDDLVMQCKIQQITFNPVAKTSIVKVLSKIGGGFVTKEDLNTIAEESGGDIRSAINAFEFKFRHHLDKLTVTTHLKENNKRPKKKARVVVDSPIPVATRQVQLSFLHVVGKIMYSKRSNEMGHAERLLPQHLHHCRRKKLKEKAENLTDAISVSSEKVNDYVHEHYIHFLSDISDVAEAASIQSDSDALCAKTQWDLASPWDRLQNLINVRGVMFSRTNEIQGQFFGFTRPSCASSVKRTLKYRAGIRQLQSFGHTPEETVLDYIPFHSLMVSSNKFSDFKSQYEMITRENLIVNKGLLFSNGMTKDSKPIPGSSLSGDEDLQFNYTASDDEIVIDE